MRIPSLTPTRSVLMLISLALMAGMPNVVAAGPSEWPFVTGQAPRGEDLPERLASHVRRAIDTFEQEGSRDAAGGDVLRFYEGRNFQPAWMSAGGREAAGVFLARMEQASADGLPATYDVDCWRMRLDTPPDTLEEVFLADVELSAAILRFASDLAHGPETDEPVRDTDVQGVLQDAADQPSARVALDRLEPQHAEYRELRRALVHHRSTAEQGGWPTVPEDMLLSLEDAPGETPDSPAAALEEGEDIDEEDRRLMEGIAAVCERLVASGDAGDGNRNDACGFGPGDRPAYNDTLERGVRQFQARHGLLVDGIVGPRTVEAINRPVEERITQIIVNMNRWRQLPDDLGRTHVFVNIPAFTLEGRDASRPVLEMRVVAGEPETATPTMSDEISYLEFSPYWNVPDSITRNSLLPQIARDPGYLARQGFDVIRGWGQPAEIVNPSTIDWQAVGDGFPYRLRQRPGPNNAMGLVKFMFPNDDAIYLHDTPADHRFEERRRAFSHGCVRVEDPVALAAFLLRDENTWSRDAIENAMHDGERQVVTLPEHVPVHLAYFTAWVEDGAVQFRGDLYGLDASERRTFESTEDSPRPREAGCCRFSAGR